MAKYSFESKKKLFKQTIIYIVFMVISSLSGRLCS